MNQYKEARAELFGAASTGYEVMSRYFLMEIINELPPAPVKAQSMEDR